MTEQLHETIADSENTGGSVLASAIDTVKDAAKGILDTKLDAEIYTGVHVMNIAKRLNARMKDIVESLGLDYKMVSIYVTPIVLGYINVKRMNRGLPPKA